MRGYLGIDDDHGLFSSPAARRSIGQHSNGAEIEYDLVDDVMALLIDADIDFLRPLLDLLGVASGSVICNSATRW